MSATRAHTPANIHDTHVKWSRARGYIHSRADLSCARAHTYTHRHTHPKKSEVVGEIKHNNYIGHYPVCCSWERERATTVAFNSTIFGNVSSPLSHATMHKSVYVNRVVDKNQTR